jgi:hypothetical protein
MVYYSDESTNRTVLLTGNIVESLPYYAFQPDADSMSRYLEAADRQLFHQGYPQAYKNHPKRLKIEIR